MSFLTVVSVSQVHVHSIHLDGWISGLVISLSRDRVRAKARVRTRARLRCTYIYWMTSCQYIYSYMQKLLKSG